MTQSLDLATPDLAQFKDFKEIRIQSVVTGRPLFFDIYIVVHGKSILFRRRGDILTKDRLHSLLKHGGKNFLVPKDQYDAFKQSMKQLIQDPDTPSDEKSILIKESAFVHVDDLFKKQDMKKVVSESKDLISEMVNFVSTDIGAVASLMRLSAHDYYTYNHCVDVAVYSIALAKRVFGNDKDMLMYAGLGGFMHDIGKREIPYEIINKSTPLTPEEWAEMKNHPRYGKEILEKKESVPEESKNVVYQHHENFDGTGYPDKLEGDQISKLARIVSIADVFDALTTDRSYHKASTPQEALKTMYSMQPGKFDPSIFKAFDKNFEKHTANLELPKNYDPCQHQDHKKFKKK